MKTYYINPRKRGANAAKCAENLLPYLIRHRHSSPETRATIKDAIKTIRHARLCLY